MGDLWHAGGVASAVGAVRAANSLLVVFSSRVESGGDDVSVEEQLGRVASRAMEKRTFGARAVREAVTRHRAVCLKLRADPSDGDYANFAALFSVDAVPCIHIVAPDGKVLLQRPYYTSPDALCRALDYAYHVRAAGDGDTEVPLPDLGLNLHAPQPLSPEVEARMERSKRAREEATQKAAAAAAAVAAAENAPQPVSGERKTVEPTTGNTTEVTRTLPASGAALQLGNRTRLQVRMASGETTTRTFDASTPLSVVAAWVGEEAGTGDMPTLAVAFPRRQFDAADASKTLSELALTPSATLIVVSGADDAGASAGALSGAAGRAGGVVSAVRGVVGVAGSFLGSFVGSTPAPETVDENEERR